MICAIQPQPEGQMTAPSDRELSLLICGYCGHDLAGWLCRDDEAA